jgi:soluble lytic murein transglycosylase-like protein
VVILQRTDFHKKLLPSNLSVTAAKTLQPALRPADSNVVKAAGIILFLSAALPGLPQGNPAAAQQDSLAKQRASIETQIRSTTNTSFFTLPPPQPPGGNTVSDCDPLGEDQLRDLIDETAVRESVKPELLRGIIHQESGARPCAVSVKGAQGLMQLMPATSEQFGVTDPFDPKQNIQAGTKFFKQLLTHYGGDVNKALAAYNAGPGRVDKAGGAVPAIAETVHYVSSILASLPH